MRRFPRLVGVGLRKPEIQRRIFYLRKSLLALRCLYYCKHESLITDFEYDRRERELRLLVKQNYLIAKRTPYHEECPSLTVGSSNLNHYPLEIFELAENLLQTHREMKLIVRRFPRLRVSNGPH